MSGEEKRRNVHFTLARGDAEALLSGEVSATAVEQAKEAIADAEKLEAAVRSARKLDEEGKLEPQDLSDIERREDLLRLIYREPDGKERRCSMFIPLPDDVPNLVAALRAAFPSFTAYTYNEAERMIRDAHAYTAEEIQDHLAEVIWEKERNPETSIWLSFWDRINEGGGRAPIPEFPDA